MAIRVEDVLEYASSAPFFTLPPELEAREPAEIRGRGRDDVRLLVTRGPLGSAEHVRFGQLPDFLDRGDLIVLNASATIPAALRARTASGAAIALHVSTRLPGDVCVVELPGHVPVPGESIRVEGGATATLLARYRDSQRLWLARFDGTGDLIEYLHRFGKPIAYAHARGEWPIETYQNFYASEAGSAEMPSAGRPFTPELLQRLRSNGVAIGQVILHTGVSSPEREEPPYEESFRVPHATARLVAQTRRAGHRIIAVGTTVVRALESASADGGEIAASRGWTDLVISPSARLLLVDGMITGFHEPRSTHLLLLEALVGRRHVSRAYAEALAGRYLWHEFGDSHLLLRD